jgi:hypothetical protein
MSQTTSRRKLESARANGAKSKGPKTPEGKARSSQNAIRHGLCAKSIVLSTEDRDEYEKLYTAYLLRFQPADQVETGLVETMINATWRERRSWSIETESLERKMVRARDWIDDWDDLSPAAQTAIGFDNVFPSSPIDRYETRMSRQYDRARKALMELRKSHPIAILPKEPSPEIDHLPQQPAPVPAPAPNPPHGLGTVVALVLAIALCLLSTAQTVSAYAGADAPDEIYTSQPPLVSSCRRDRLPAVRDQVKAGESTCDRSPQTRSAGGAQWKGSNGQRRAR